MCLDTHVRTCIMGVTSVQTHSYTGAVRDQGNYESKLVEVAADRVALQTLEGVKHQMPGHT